MKKQFFLITTLVGLLFFSCNHFEGEVIKGTDKDKGKDFIPFKAGIVSLRLDMKSDIFQFEEVKLVAHASAPKELVESTNDELYINIQIPEGVEVREEGSPRLLSSSDTLSLAKALTKTYVIQAKETGAKELAFSIFGRHNFGAFQRLAVANARYSVTPKKRRVIATLDRHPDTPSYTLRDKGILRLTLIDPTIQKVDNIYEANSIRFIHIPSFLTGIDPVQVFEFPALSKPTRTSDFQSILNIPFETYNVGTDSFVVEYSSRGKYPVDTVKVPVSVISNLDFVSSIDLQGRRDTAYTNMPLSVQMTNTTTLYARYDYRWEIASSSTGMTANIDTNGKLTLTAQDTGEYVVSVRLREFITNYEKTYAFTFYFIKPHLRIIHPGTLTWYGNATKSLNLPIAHTTDYNLEYASSLPPTYKWEVLNAPSNVTASFSGDSNLLLYKNRQNGLGQPLLIKVTETNSQTSDSFTIYANISTQTLSLTTHYKGVLTTNGAESGIRVVTNRPATVDSELQIQLTTRGLTDAKDLGYSSTKYIDKEGGCYKQTDTYNNYSYKYLDVLEPAHFDPVNPTNSAIAFVFLFKTILINKNDGIYLRATMTNYGPNYNSRNCSTASSPLSGGNSNLGVTFQYDVKNQEIPLSVSANATDNVTGVSAILL